MDDTKLVDEEEVYRFFGGCLPVVLANRKYYFKTLRQLNAQRVGHANNISISFKLYHFTLFRFYMLIPGENGWVSRKFNNEK